MFSTVQLDVIQLDRNPSRSRFPAAHPHPPRPAPAPAACLIYRVCSLKDGCGGEGQGSRGGEADATSLGIYKARQHFKDLEKILRPLWS